MRLTSKPSDAERINLNKYRVLFIIIAKHYFFTSVLFFVIPNKLSVKLTLSITSTSFRIVIKGSYQVEARYQRLLTFSIE